MTGEIGELLERIRERMARMHQELVDLRVSRDSLKSDNDRLQAALLAQEMRGTKLEQQLRESREQLEIQREQENQRVATEAQKRDEAIDGLVKEIDHCIKQLQTTNE